MKTYKIELNQNKPDYTSEFDQYFIVSITDVSNKIPKVIFTTKSNIEDIADTLYNELNLDAYTHDDEFFIQSFTQFGYIEQNIKSTPDQNKFAAIQDIAEDIQGMFN